VRPCFFSTMPELPEVETFTRILRDGQGDYPSLLGLVIASAEVLWPKTLAAPSSREFSGILNGQSIQGISRRGKYLVFQLTRHYLLFHLRMSGDMVTVHPGEANPPHTRFAIRFQNGMTLAFNDPRKFGRVWLVNDPSEVMDDLGIEPFDPDLTYTLFKGMLRKKDRHLKPLLLDQTFMAGIGNIYSDEALHLARLHPLRKASSLKDDEAARLLDAIRSVLTEGIQRNGSSIDWVYRGGEYQNNFRVYGRTGKPCPVCGNEIIHLNVGQRSTHICPNCQRMED
jgi:formamidopyrimidine-DNA glycosylase